MAPFFYVTFADFWVADQLNSLVTLFTDLQYFVCFYFTNPSWSVGVGLYLLVMSQYNIKSIRFGRCQLLRRQSHVD